MAKPMTKTQLVAALADKMGSDKKTAGAALDGIIAIITDEVGGGGIFRQDLAERRRKGARAQDFGKLTQER